MIVMTMLTLASHHADSMRRQPKGYQKNEGQGEDTPHHQGPYLRRAPEASKATQHGIRCR